MNLFGKPDVSRLVAAQDLDALHRLLEHRDRMVVLEAAQGLAELHDGTGWRILMDAVQKGTDPDMRVVAAAMLGELSHPRAVPVLADILIRARSTQVDSQLVETAREALTAIGGREAEEALREAGYDLREIETDPEMSDFDAEFVKPVLPRTDLVQFLTAEQHLNIAVELREAELAERGLVENSLALWLKPDWAYAWYLRGVLYEDLDRTFEAWLAYRRAVEIDPAQHDARDALAELESEFPYDLPDEAALLQDLGRQDWEKRRDAAAGLGELGDPANIARLIAALEDEEREVRHAAISALGNLAKPTSGEAENAVHALLMTEEQSWLARFAVIEALSSWGSADGLAQFLRGEMERLQERNPVFTSRKDPLVEVEYDRLMEVGVLAFERTGSLDALLDLAEENDWEEVDEQQEEEEAGFDAMDAYGFDDDEADEEADEDLSSYVDEVAQIIVIALDRLAITRLPKLDEAVLHRLSRVPDLTLLDLEDEEAQPVVVYDLDALRSAAAQELARRKK